MRTVIQIFNLGQFESKYRMRRDFRVTKIDSSLRKNEQNGYLFVTSAIRCVKVRYQLEWVRGSRVVGVTKILNEHRVPLRRPAT